jgi:hypothetical protein
VESSQKLLASAPYTSWTQFIVPQLESLGIVQYEVLEEDREALVLEPLNRRWRLRWRPLSPADRVKGSRFAHLRVENGKCFLETPLQPTRILFRDPRLWALWGFLAEARDPVECARLTDTGFSEELVLQ